MTIRNEILLALARSANVSNTGSISSFTATSYTGSNAVFSGTVSASDFISPAGITGNTTILEPSSTGSGVAFVDSGSGQLASFSAGDSSFAGNVEVDGFLQVDQYIQATGNIIAGGNITAGNINANVNGYSIGYRTIPQITWNTTTIGTDDSGKHYYTNSGGVTLNIPTNSSVTLPIGTAVSVVNESTSNCTIAPAVGVTLILGGNATAGTRTLSWYGAATLLKVATDRWFISGSNVI
jgi:hypothetical protein